MLYNPNTARILIWVVLLCNLLIVNAQNVSLEATPKTQDILGRFDARFSLLDSIIFKTVPQKYMTEVFDTTFLNFSDPERIREVDAAIEAQVTEFKSRTGLDFRGQAYIRPGKSGLSYDPDDPLVAYNAKLQAELEWNIFHSSIYKRASKIKELKLKGDLRQLNYVKNDLKDQILFQEQFIRYRHYGRLLSVINLHVENVRLLMETQMYLLEHGKISGEDMLKLINEQTELERQLISIKADSVINELPPPVDIAYIERTDTAGIIKSIRDNNVELKKLGLRAEILDLQRHNTDYVQTMNILPFVRYSYYNRENAHNTYNLDVGVSFRIPFSGEVAKKRKALEAEKDVLAYEQQQLENETTKGILLAFHDLEIYNENILGEYLRMKTLKEFLQMRGKSYDNVDGEYSRINRLIEYNAYLQAWERLLEYTYRRDCILLELQSFMPAESISNYVQFKDLN